MLEGEADMSYLSESKKKKSFKIEDKIRGFSEIRAEEACHLY